MKGRVVLIVVGVLVVIGAIIGIIVGVSSGKDSKNGDGKGSDDSSSPVSGKKNVSDSELIAPSNSSGENDNTPKSDPEKATAAVTMLAIGDWGATTDKPGSCCNKYRKTTPDSIEEKTDYWAQINIAEIFSQSAAQLKPTAVIGHGDNIYWNGAGPDDIEFRMETTFESVYDSESLKDVPWINVVGNHDLGGSEYICGDKDYTFRECESAEELLKYLDLKFTLQQNYKSPQGNRWKLKDHYYVESFEKDGVSIEIYNIDTNFAESHGVMQICCQCYGYTKQVAKSEEEAKKIGKTCNDQKPGDKLCAGGDVGMYNACAAKIEEWWNDSMTKVQADLAKSKATWKIINSHYSPHFHMSEPKMKQWYKIAKDGGVQVWLNGHTHGFNHDISNWGTHFFENGGGGGIQSETSGYPPEVAEKFVSNTWIAPGAPYGFFELSFSKEWLKIQFVTFDDAWRFSKVKSEIVKGKFKKGHCWHVPYNMGKGKECTASA